MIRVRPSILFNKIYYQKNEEDCYENTILLYFFIFVAALFSPYAEADAQQASYTSEAIIFHSGDFTLVGELKIPGGNEPHGVVIFVHGDRPKDRTSGGSYPPITELVI